ARVDAARTAAAQAAGALAAATDGVQRESQQEGQLRQQLVRIGGLLQQAEQTEVETLGRQRALGETETTADLELAALEQQIVEVGALEASHLPHVDTLAALEAQLREDEQRNVTLQVELAHADDAWTASVADHEAAQIEVDRCALALREGGQEVEDDTEAVEDV